MAGNQLPLDREELLTTLALLLADTKENKGIILAVGEGLACVNVEVTEFSQDNRPDYLGFHLGEDFETWYAGQQQKIPFIDIQDISIANDGIFMFSPVRNTNGQVAVDAIKFQMPDKSGTGQEDMLDRNLNKPEHEFGLKPSDDIAIARLVS